MLNTLAQNVRDLGSNPTLEVIFPIFISPMTTLIMTMIITLMMIMMMIMMMMMIIIIYLVVLLNTLRVALSVNVLGGGCE